MSNVCTALLFSEVYPDATRNGDGTVTLRESELLMGARMLVQSGVSEGQYQASLSAASDIKAQASGDLNLPCARPGCENSGVGWVQGYWSCVAHGGRP